MDPEFKRSAFDWSSNQLDEGDLSDKGDEEDNPEEGIVADIFEWVKLLFLE